MEYELTEREQNIVLLVAEGNRNEAIAKELNISVHTVKAHLESIFYKLKVSSRVQAVVRAIQNNIIDIETIVVKEKVFE